MQKFTNLLKILLFIFFLTSGLQAQIDPNCAARLQTVLDSMRAAQSQNVKGISAGVLIPGRGIWLGASGFSHGSVPITPGMKFCIASNTKLFISVVMLKLAELNILSLDDSLHEWLPNFQNVNPNITIRQLLNHTSGVYHYVDNNTYASTMNADTGRFWTPQEILSTFVSGPYFNPGGGYHYSNTNYLLAGLIIQAATGQLVSNRVRQFILNPLNLNSTFFPLVEGVLDTIAHGWANNIEYSYPWTSWTSSQWSAGNMYSTAENLLRWHDSLFSGRILSQSSMNQMLSFSPQSGYTYGLGIMRATPNGITKWQHDGILQKGYRSAVRIDSASKYIISILINQHVNQNEPNPFPFVNALDNVVRTMTACWNISGTVQNNVITPNVYVLNQNYPNPFNPATKIKFSISTKNNIKIKIYDTLGREIEVLVNQELKPGNYEVNWDASKYPSGVYFYQLKAGKYIETKKMILMK